LRGGWTGGNDTLIFDGDANHRIYPVVSNQLSLGITGNRWKKIWTVDITTTNAIVTDSDVNLKEDINNTALGLNFINLLRPVSYRLINGESGRLHYGLIAQEVEQVMIDEEIDSTDFAILVKEPKRDFATSEPITPLEYDYGIRYQELIAPMIKAIQELTAQNAALEARILALETP